MHSMTPTVIPAPRPKPGLQAYLGWFLAIIAIPATAYFLLGVAAVVDREWGVVGVVVGLAFFPVTLVLTPLYAGFAHGEWMLVGLMAGLVAAGSLFQMLDRDVAHSSG